MNPPTTPMVLLTFSAGVVAATSYGCSLALAHLLTPGQFATYAAVSALITAAGVASTALIPLPLAAAVRGHGPGAPQRRDALTFALLAALVGGTASAVLVAGPAAALSDAPVVVAAVAAVIGLFALAPIWGLLQGESRYRRYAVLSVVEVVARVLATGASLALGAGAAGAVGAFAAGPGW